MSEHDRNSPHGDSTRIPSTRPQSYGSTHSDISPRSGPHSRTSELTPLLPRDDENVGASAQSDPQSTSAASLLRSVQGKGKSSRRRPSLVALLLLCLVVLIIIILGFFAPAIAQEYAMQAATFEPTSLSIDSFTSTGVKARIQGDFTMDGSKVKKKPVRDLGRFGTWIAREVETGESHVQVSLPEYDDVILGTATIPSIKANIRNGHTTHVDFLSDLTPGDVDGIKHIAKKWVDGKLGQLRVQGVAAVPVKSGLFNFGQQKITQFMTFKNKEIPTMPKYQIHKINVHEIELPNLRKAMAADVTIQVGNDYPLGFVVPPLGFAVLVDGCDPGHPIQLADAETGNLKVHPKEDLNVTVSGYVRQLPDAFTRTCPQSHESPLDALLGTYIHGNDTTIYVRGSDSPSKHTPRWITDIMSDITIPVAVPGHTFGHLIEKFSLANVHFSLPDPFAEPDTPEAQPHISAQVKAIVALPSEMNFNVSVGRVRANADIFYHGSKLGYLDLHEWQKANSSRVESDSHEGPRLAVESAIENAPLTITDDDVFTKVIEALMFGGKPVTLAMKAEVDVELDTALGKLAIRKIPASGTVPVKPIRRGGIGEFTLKIGNLQILDSGESSLTFEALVNFTNPTEYTATIPYADINILVNGSIMAHATAKTLNVGPGLNTNIPVTAVWDPLSLSGEEGRAVGVEFLSQYISGWNTTMTLQTHEGTIPAQPTLGRALQKFKVEMPTPSLRGPRDDDDNDDGAKKGPHFIEDATMHLITSTASFTLLSPLKTSTIIVTYINATAFYHEDDVGHIDYDEPFAVPPGATTSPRLPVAWSLGSVGYDAVKGALGGTLKLAARATVGIKLGRWEERIWFQGRGIGAHIRL